MASSFGNSAILGPQDYFLSKSMANTNNSNSILDANNNADLGIADHNNDILTNYRDDRILLSENLELKNNNEFLKSLISKLQDFLKLYQTR